MKKISLIILIALCLPTLSMAQSRFRLGFRLNPLVSIAQMTDKDKSEISGLSKSGRIGISSGLMGHYSLSDKLGLYGGIMVAFKGFKSNANYTPKEVGAIQRNVVQNASLTYLEIPLALHILSNEITTGMKIRGTFGLSLNFLVGANTTRNEYIIDIMKESGFKNENLRTESDLELIPFNNNTSSRSGTSGYNVFVPDFIVGAGVDWNIEGVGAFDFGISYHQALGVVNKYALRGDDRVRISYLSFDLGYFF